jgi:hypothetical protein
MSDGGNQLTTIRDKRVRRLVIGALCLVAGVALLLSIVLRATIVQMPIKLQGGETIQTNFTAKTSAPLWIELRLDRHQGVSDEVINQAIHPSNKNVDIDWLVRDKETVASGNSATARGGSSTPGTRTLFIGYLGTDHAGNYEFRAKINMKRNIPGLAAANPRLVIWPAQTGSYTDVVWVKLITGVFLILFGLMDVSRSIRKGKALQAPSASAHAPSRQ